MCDKFNKLLRDGNQRLVIFSKKNVRWPRFCYVFGEEEHTSVTQDGGDKRIL